MQDNSSHAWVFSKVWLGTNNFWWEKNRILLCVDWV